MESTKYFGCVLYKHGLCTDCKYLNIFKILLKKRESRYFAGNNFNKSITLIMNIFAFWHFISCASIIFTLVFLSQEDIRH